MSVFYVRCFITKDFQSAIENYQLNISFYVIWDFGQNFTSIYPMNGSNIVALIIIIHLGYKLIVSAYRYCFKREVKIGICKWRTTTATAASENISKCVWGCACVWVGCLHDFLLSLTLYQW